MRKQTICICENKDADQLRCNCEADQRLCFRYTDNTIPLLLKSKISSFEPSSVLVLLCLCQTCSETTLLVFPRGCYYVCLFLSEIFYVDNISKQSNFMPDYFPRLNKSAAGMHDTPPRKFNLVQNCTLVTLIRA